MSPRTPRHHAFGRSAPPTLPALCPLPANAADSPLLSRLRRSTPLHYDATNNFFCQLQGAKRALLFPPSQSFLLYPHLHNHPMASYAIADPSSPELERLPALAHARGVEACLEAGDVLWLPAYWWHFVSQAVPGQAGSGRADGGRSTGDAAPGGDVATGGNRNLSINFWVGGTAEDKRTGAYDRAEQVRAARGEAAMPSGEAVAACAADAAATHRARSKAAEAVRSARAAGSGLDAAELEVEGDGGLLSLLLAMRIEVVAAAHFKGLEKGGPLIAALAAGGDAGVGAGDAWPLDTPDAIALATGIRRQALALLRCPKKVNALLRSMSHDGRLFPGLAPKVHGPTVNSEKGGVTPQEDVRKLMAVEREGEWGEGPWM